MTSFEAALPGDWRRYGLALLPLVLVGWMPLWMCLLLCLIFGMAVREERWLDARFILCGLVPVLGTLVDLPNVTIAPERLLIIYGARFMAWMIALSVLNLAAVQIESGRRWALLAVLALGLVAPQPWLGVALGGGALALPGRDGYATRRSEAGAGRFALGLLLASLLLGFALPRQTFVWEEIPVFRGAAPGGLEPPPVSPPNREPPRSGSTAPPRTGGGRVLERAPNTGDPFGPGLVNAFNIALVVGPFMFLLGIVALLRLTDPRRTRRRLTPLEVLTAASMMLTIAFWIASMVLAGMAKTGAGELGRQPGGPEGSVEGGGGSNLPPIELIRDASSDHIARTLGWGLIGTALLTTVLLTAAVVALLRLRKERSEPPLLTDDEALATIPDALQSNRVRAAYREAETALSDAGLGRPASETPARYFERLGAELPDLQPALGDLLSAYQPVRYGEDASEREAVRAERASSAIRDFLDARRAAEPKEPS